MSLCWTFQTKHGQTKQTKHGQRYTVHTLRTLFTFINTPTVSPEGSVAWFDMILTFESINNWRTTFLLPLSLFCIFGQAAAFRSECHFNKLSACLPSERSVHGVRHTVWHFFGPVSNSEAFEGCGEGKRFVELPNTRTTLEPWNSRKFKVNFIIRRSLMLLMAPSSFK